MKRILISFIVLVLAFAGLAAKRESGREFLVAGHSARALYRIDEKGVIAWSYKNVPSAQDVWELANGNLLFSHLRGATEISLPDNKVVWDYKSDAEKVEVHSCQPLPNGNVLICECGPKRLLEINREGKIAKEIKIDTATEGTHGQFRMARYTKDGTYLVGCLKEGKVKEYDGAGKLLKEFSAAKEGYKSMHGCLRLKNGNTLTSTGYGGGVFEFDKDGKVVWSYLKSDMPDRLKNQGNSAKYAAGIQRLSNGNTTISYYSSNPQFVEVTREKEMVWEYYNPDLKNIASQTRLGERGDPAKLEILR